MPSNNQQEKVAAPRVMDREDISGLKKEARQREQFWKTLVFLIMLQTFYVFLSIELKLNQLLIF